MTRKLTSILSGAACAALLILPSMSGEVEAGNAPASNWGSWPAHNYQARRLKLEDIVGTVVVNVRDGGPMTVEAWGDNRRLHGLHAEVQGDQLDIEGGNENDGESVWDWHHWFDFSNVTNHSPHDLNVRVTIPRGSDVDIESLVGDVSIGDTQAALHLEAAATKAHIGRVASANIEVGGSGRIDIASVTGTLKLDVGGSGKISTGPIGNLQADIAGSSDAQFGPINGSMNMDIAGAGDVTAARVNGPTHVTIAGSGAVKVADGTADPLHVEIMGSGKFDFGGVAVDPHIEAFGSGNVHLHAYRGKLNTEGMADVKIGD